MMRTGAFSFQTTPGRPSKVAALIPLRNFSQALRAIVRSYHLNFVSTSSLLHRSEETTPRALLVLMRSHAAADLEGRTEQMGGWCACILLVETRHLQSVWHTYRYTQILGQDRLIVEARAVSVPPGDMYKCRTVKHSYHGYRHRNDVQRGCNSVVDYMKRDTATSTDEKIFTSAEYSIDQCLCKMVHRFPPEL
ncbi:hypothetical protein E1B28_010806 [Marasmius oreades]|uniref:Uncharacterized protein n=1 Tax=Marasmius oreades TaxID=181124 RepID=A0A9P7RSZ7_9AGAR|nr:uncharacterized protein E1B28_010806 [Marasmius oreades]KAG7089097.1 hypothetical protein E1B28_010806 [Marasmius oreades]